MAIHFWKFWLLIRNGTLCQVSSHINICIYQNPLIFLSPNGNRWEFRLKKCYNDSKRQGNPFILHIWIQYYLGGDSKCNFQNEFTKCDWMSPSLKLALLLDCSMETWLLNLCTVSLQTHITHIPQFNHQNTVCAFSLKIVFVNWMFMQL